MPPTVADMVLRRSASNGIDARLRHTRDLRDEPGQTVDPPIQKRPGKRGDGRGRPGKGFTDVDCASDTEFVRMGSHDPRHHAAPNPWLELPMTGLERGVSVGDIRPRCASR